MKKWEKYKQKFRQAELEELGGEIGDESWWPDIIQAIEEGGSIPYIAHLFLPKEMVDDLLADGWVCEVEHIQKTGDTTRSTKIIYDWES